MEPVKNDDSGNDVPEVTSDYPYLQQYYPYPYPRPPYPEQPYPQWHDPRQPYPQWHDPRQPYPQWHDPRQPYPQYNYRQPYRQYPRYVPPPKLYLPGERMVSVTAIVVICLSIVSMFGIIQTLVLRGSVNRVYELMGIDSSLRVFFNVWGVIAPLIILAFGILCKKYSGKPEKAKHIIIMGFAYLGLQIAGILMNIQLYIQMLDTTFARSLLSSNYPAELIEPVVKIITSILIFSVVIGLIIGFIIPAFLVVGGFKLNKVYMNIAESESGS